MANESASLLSEPAEIEGPSLRLDSELTNQVVLWVLKTCHVVIYSISGSGYVTGYSGVF